MKQARLQAKNKTTGIQTPINQPTKANGCELVLLGRYRRRRNRPGTCSLSPKKRCVCCDLLVISLSSCPPSCYSSGTCGILVLFIIRDCQRSALDRTHVRASRLTNQLSAPIPSNLERKQTSRCLIFDKQQLWITRTPN